MSFLKQDFINSSNELGDRIRMIVQDETAHIQNQMIRPPSPKQVAPIQEKYNDSHLKKSISDLERKLAEAN